MKFIKNIASALAFPILFGMVGCYDQELHPVTEEQFPLKIVLDELEGGTYESDDAYGLEVSFDGGVDEVVDENGNVIAGSPEGTRGPYTNDITVNFELKDAEGLTIGENVSIADVVYVDPTDECQELSASFTFNVDGTGSFTIPAGIEVVEVLFQLDVDIIDDDDVNDEDRIFVMAMTSINGATEGEVVIDLNNEFEYTVLDDEVIFTEWVLDHNDASAFSDFVTLYAPLNEDLESLNAGDVREIKFEFAYNELKIAIELNETEMVDECEEVEEKNVELEFEGEFEVEDGEIEIEFENEDEDEFAYEGSYIVTQGSPNKLDITLTGENEDGEEVAAETSLSLERD